MEAVAMRVGRGVPSSQSLVVPHVLQAFVIAGLSEDVQLVGACL